jgi:PhnB protein
MSVKPIPDGLHTVTPYMIIDGASKLIDFLKQAFEATEMNRMNNPDNSIGHAAIRIGDSVLMMSDARGDWKSMPSAIYLYVNDTDATYKRALQAGATSVMEPADQFYGDRNAGVKDPVGNFWWIATHKEDLSSEEMGKRAEEYMKKQQRG